MTPILLAFGAFAILILSAALFVALTQRIIHAGFALFFALLGLAGIYVLLGADFLGVAQIIVYVGGILILLLFGVMLTHRHSLSQGPRTRLHNLVPGLLVAVAVPAVLLYSFRNVIFTAPDLVEAQLPPSVVEAYGQALLTTHLLPFELASIILLLALVAAAYLSRKADDAPQTNDTH